MTQLMDSSIAKQFDRLPPSAIEMEKCLLAAMMLDETRQMIGDIVQIVDRDAFYQTDHQIIFDVLLKLYEQNRPIDAIIVREELAKRQLLDEIGGTAYLAAILATVPSAAHGTHYAGIVREKALLRQLIAASNDILRDAYAPHEKADLVLDKAEKKIFEIAQKKVGGQMQAMEEVLHEVFEMIENRGQRGVETGFLELDDMMNGLQNGEMIIIAARPSMGKAQPLDAKILMNDGRWTEMGDLCVGDELASIDGAPSRIAGIFPQGRRQVYRITFEDGRHTECCDEHLWRIQRAGWDQPRILTTRHLIKLLDEKRGNAQLSVEQISGEFGVDDELPLDPWLVGATISDAPLGDPGQVSAESLSPLPVLRPAVSAVELERVRVRANSNAAAISTLPVLETNEGHDARVTACIPEQYMRASRSSRIRLLAGLTGTDAWDDKFIFRTTNRRLAADVVDLVRSIGGSASIRTLTHSPGMPGAICLPTNVFEIELNPSCQSGLRIQSIEPTRFAQTQCIAVTHPSHLYITDDYIVTHNTAMAMNIIEHIAADNRLPCAVFSLEMSKQQLAQRMLCSRGQIDAHKLRKGMLQSHEYQKLASVVGELAKAPIWVDDSPGLTPLELRAKARRLKLQHDVKCVMIDYMQLMDNPGPENRQQQISEISRGIKAVARELNVPVLALSQLNRASEGRDGHRPRMSDLRESGSIEQDADVIMLLHREDYYRMSEPDFQPDNIAEIIIAKQRNGPTGTVKLAFMNKTTRFENLSTQADPFQ